MNPELAKRLHKTIMAGLGLIDDQQALEGMELYPLWQEGTEYAAGERVRFFGNLYKVLQAHTAQSEWLPGSTGSESLYARIDKVHEGTAEDPIPYDGNMELESGKYYCENGTVYKCTRSTGEPVHHALADLVGLYVEEVSAE